ncbi:BatD family protein, partial [bacterium]
MRKIVCIFGIITFFLGILYAGDITVSADISKEKAAVGEQIVYQIHVRGAMNLSAPNFPQVKGLVSYKSGTSQSMSIINGKSSSSLIFNYMVTAQKEGTYIIPGVHINYQGKKYITNSVRFTAYPQSQSYQSTPQRSNIPDTSRQKTKDIFITTSVDKKNVYVNEPIVLTFALYSSVNFLRQPRYQPPSMSGFWVEDIPDQREYIKDYKGTRYSVIEKTTILFPTLQGEYTIGPAGLDAYVQDVDVDDFWGGFFSRGKNVPLRTKPIKINVKKFPSQGKPNSFKGAVGRYKMSVGPDSYEVEVGQAVNLIIKIKGQGNIKFLPEPVIKNINSFRKYDTISSVNIDRNPKKIVGTKTFKVVLVPKVVGKTKLPDVEFSFFDSKTKKYAVLKSESIYLNVLPAKIRGLGKDTSGYARIGGSDINLISDDIRFIKSGGSLEYAKQPVYKRQSFLFNVIVFPLLYFILLLFRFYNLYLGKNRGMILKRRASRLAVNRIDSSLKNIKKHHKNITPDLFSALSQYLSHRFGIKVSGMSIKEVEQILRKHEVEEDIIEKIKDIWG